MDRTLIGIKKESGQLVFFQWDFGTFGLSFSGGTATARTSPTPLIEPKKIRLAPEAIQTIDLPMLRYQETCQKQDL